MQTKALLESSLIFKSGKESWEEKKFKKHWIRETFLEISIPEFQLNITRNLSPTHLKGNNLNPAEEGQKVIDRCTLIVLPGTVFCSNGLGQILYAEYYVLILVQYLCTEWHIMQTYFYLYLKLYVYMLLPTYVY